MKKILLIVIVLALLPSTGFGYMEDRLYCSVNQQDIKISLKATEGKKCQSYIIYIEQTMRQNARDLYTLQGYINHAQDAAYRKQIKISKLATINKLQAIRLNVIASMKTFEFNLLRKSVEYFTLQLAPYKVQLTKSLNTLSIITGTLAPDVQRYQSLLSGQVQTIDKISQVQTVEELIPLLSGYIYFKQQISGKSE